MWRRVDLVNLTDVLEERIASIFRVEKFASEEPAWEIPIHNLFYTVRTLQKYLLVKT
jgi:hypothetical protein